MAERLGRYRLDELLGRGGMGEVWRATDLDKNRVVAIKLLLPHLASDEAFVARFRRESQLAGRLANPHVIPVHDYGVIDGRLFLDMQFVPGTDLAALLGRGRLDPQRAVEIVAQVGEALDAAHALGLVHRDVKPSNIMVVPDGRGRDFVYLLDFGIAHALDTTSLTTTGGLVGTLPYMAPERFGDGPDDHRVDVYAMACVLHECLTGDVPFRATTPAAMIGAHLTSPPPRPSKRVPSLPPALDGVVAAGLAKDPAGRLGSAGALAGAALAALRPTASAPTRRPAGAPGARDAPAPSPAPSPVTPPVTPPITVPSGTPNAPDPAPVARAALAAFLGSTLTFFAVAVFGMTSVLLFDTTFFGDVGGAGAGLAFAAAAVVAFVLRPAGAVVFGRIGDRTGRSRAVAACFLLGGLATAVIGLLPSARTVGIAAPVTLVLLFGVLGVAAGGVVAGVALLVVERAPTHRRGLWGGFPQVGPGLAAALANGALLLLQFHVPSDYPRVGWRIPFAVAGVVLVMLGVWVWRFGEAPAFRRGAARAPLRDAWRRQGKRILLVAGVLVTSVANVFGGTVFLVPYARQQYGLTGPTYGSGIVGGLAFVAAAAVSAMLSDRLGRRFVLVLSCTVAAVVPPVALVFVLGPGPFVGRVEFATALALFMAVAGLVYGPMAAYVTELFSAAHRYTAASSAYALAAAAGGVALFVDPATAVRINTILALVAVAMFGLLCVAALPETRGAPME